MLTDRVVRPVCLFASPDKMTIITAEKNAWQNINDATVWKKEGNDWRVMFHSDMQAK